LNFVNIIYTNFEVVINELNSNTPQKPEKLEYIELRCFQLNNGEVTSGRRASLDGLKLLIISGYHTKYKSPTIEMVANLWNCK
jgi:hypothetical protein